jgi:dipeptidase D
VSGLPGGHSGVEIHKNIPNAIKVMATYLQDKEVLIASATGGERRNSIPTEIVVQLTSKAPLPESQWVEVKAIDTPLEVYQTEALLSLLRTFENGVITYNEEFDLPDSSINLAILEFEAGRVTIECSSRAMSDEVLERINNHYLKLFEKYGFDGKIEYKYPAWRPEINPFSSMVNDAMHEVFGASRYEAIHAGLECGMLLEKYPTIKFASIGPTILSPHSTSERVKLDSVENTFRVVEKIIAKVQN